MNRIYRLIWNTALNCWMVASEHTKGRSKRAKTVGSSAVAAALVLAMPAYASEPLEELIEEESGLGLFQPPMAPSPFAFASRAVSDAIGILGLHQQNALVTDDSYRNATISGNNSIILGSRSSLTGYESVAYGNGVTVNANQAVAIGFGAKASSTGAIAQGYTAEARTIDAIAIGRSSLSAGADTVAVGYGTKATGSFSVALGSRAQAGGANSVSMGVNSISSSDYSVALGSASRTQSYGAVAVGASAVVNTGAGVNGIALGTAARAGTAGYTGAVAVGGRSDAQYDGIAVGHDAKAQAIGSVALGTGSIANQGNSVSVGNATLKRKLVNVADGEVSETSTDVVTGRQLNAMRNQFNSNIITLGSNASANVEGGIAIGADAVATAGAGISRIALGAGAKAGSAGWSGGMALGGGAQSNFDGIAIGHDSRAHAQSSIAIGRAAEATEAFTVSVGSDTVKRRVVNVGEGKLEKGSSDAVTGNQLFNVSEVANTATSKLSSTRTSIGAEATAAGVNGTAVGQKATASGSHSHAFGTGAVASADNALAMGTLASSASTDGIAIGDRAAVAAKAASGIALGANTNAEGLSAMAIGSQASATGNYGSAIGREAKATGDWSNAMGSQAEAAGHSSVAIGSLAASVGTQSVAVGDRAMVNSAAQHGVALGYSSSVQAAASNAVALGYGSVATKANTVSVGSGSLKRAIVNMAEGSEAAGSSEAITGGQLYRTKQDVTAADAKATAASTAATAATTVAKAAETAANVAIGRLNSDATHLGSGASAGATASAMGKQASASGSHSSAVGAYAASAGANAIAMGTYSAGASDSAIAVGNRAGVDATAANSVALGANAKVNANASNAIALGAGSVASAKDTISVGSTSLQRKVVNVADGALTSTSTDAVTGKQLFAATQKLDATDSKLTVTTATANTAKTTAERAGTTATDALTKANVLGGLVSQASATASVRLGADNAGTILDVRNKSNAGRMVTGLANGAVTNTSTDAVTGKQLFDQQQSVNTNASKIGANESGIAGNQTGIGKNRDDIAGNRTSIGDNRTAIEALRSDFNDYVPELEGVVMFNADRTRVDMEGARVTGLLDGDVSVGSKDAVTGGQLFDSNVRISGLEEQHQYLVVGSDQYSEKARAGIVAVAIGDSAEASLSTEGATAVGSFAKARGENSVALGRAAHVHEGASQGFALGTASQVEVSNGVALGAGSMVKAGASNSVALGYASIADEANSVSVGHSTYKRRLVNVASGRKADDATTVAQLNETLASLGGGAKVDAAGEIVAPTYNLKSGIYRNVGAALTALDGTVTSARDGVDLLDSRLNRMFQEEATARTDGPGRLNLGGAQGMVLGNVANGLIAAGSRDAVNGGQLYATNQQVGQNRDAISGLREELSGAGKDAVRSLMRSDGPSFNFGGSRLTGVGAGDISSADSKDAVNGSQLFETNGRVSALENSHGYVKVGFDQESRPARAGWLAVAVGDSAEASPDGAGATAIGSYAKALGTNSVALGRGSAVATDARNGFALGSLSRVEVAGGLAIGGSATVAATALHSVALGYQSVAVEENVVSLGNDRLKRRITNVANGTADHDAATVGQLKRIASAFGGSVEVDANGNPTAPSFNVQGGEYRSVGDALSALDSSANDTDKSVGALDNRLNRLFQEEATARTDGPGRLNLGGANGMVLGNVANGMISAGSRDAVNGGQLYEVRKDLQGQIDNLAEGEKRVAVSGRMAAPVPMSAEGGGDAIASTDAPAPAPTPTPTPTPVASEASAPEPVVKAEGDTAVAVGSEGKERSVKHVAKGTADTDAVNVAQLNDVLVRSNEYTDQAVEGLNKRLDGMDKRFNRMAAMSSAQSAMAMNTAGLNTYNRLGAGVGHSDGESALAVGYQRVMNERGSATFSLNGAFTNSGEKTVGVGVGIGW